MQRRNHFSFSLNKRHVRHISLSDDKFYAIVGLVLFRLSKYSSKKKIRICLRQKIVAKFDHIIKDLFHFLQAREGCSIHRHTENEEVRALLLPPHYTVAWLRQIAEHRNL